MWSACCNSIPLFRTNDWECCPQALSSSMTKPRSHNAAATKRLLQRFQWEIFDHPQSSAQTLLRVISSLSSYETVLGGQHFGIMSSRLAERTDRAQAAGFSDEGIGKLVPRYEKCLRQSVDYIEN